MIYKNKIYSRIKNSPLGNNSTVKVSDVKLTRVVAGGICFIESLVMFNYTDSGDSNTLSEKTFNETYRLGLN